MDGKGTQVVSPKVGSRGWRGICFWKSPYDLPGGCVNADGWLVAQSGRRQLEGVVATHSLGSHNVEADVDQVRFVP